MTKKVQLVSMITPATRRAIDRAKRQKKTTLSALVEAALAQYLGASGGPRLSPETKAAR